MTYELSIYEGYTCSGASIYGHVNLDGGGYALPTEDVFALATGSTTRSQSFPQFNLATVTGQTIFYVTAQTYMSIELTV